MNQVLQLQFPIWILWIVFAVVLFRKAKLCGRKEWQEEPWSLEVSKGILGIFAILIMVHHLAQELVDEPAIKGFLFLEDWGVCFVGVFFFFSGYGLMKSILTKQDYLNGFFKKRFIKILIPFYGSILVFLFYNIAIGESYKASETIAYVTGWKLINPHMWYMIEIALLYTIFYMIFRFVKNINMALILTGASIIPIVIGSLFLGHGEYWFQGEWWYNTVFLFFIGILIAKEEKRFFAFAKKTYFILLPVGITLFFVLYQGTKHMLNTYSYWSEYENPPGYLDKFRCLSFQLPMVITFIFILLLIMLKVRFSNKVLSFLGGISLELYLIHNLFIIMLRDSKVVYIKSTSMYFFMVIGSSILLAYMLNRVNRYFIQAFSVTQKETEISTRNHSIDVIRFMACFLVVCIHAPFHGTLGAVFIAFGKIAVPFFLVVCGYYLYSNNNFTFRHRLKKQIKRIFFLTIFSYLGYLVISYLFLFNQSWTELVDQCFRKESIMNLLLYNLPPVADHLWFLGSLLYALILIFILNKFKIDQYIMFAAPILLGCYVYFSRSQEAPYYVYRNVLLVTMPYVMMGALIRRYEKHLIRCKSKVLIGIAFLLCISNLLELRYYQTVGIAFISAELLVYVIVLLCIKCPNVGKGTVVERIGREYSLFIYIVHFAFLYILSNDSRILIYFGAIVIFIDTLILAVITKKSIKLFRKKPETFPDKTGVI